MLFKLVLVIILNVRKTKQKRRCNLKKSTLVRLSPATQQKIAELVKFGKTSDVIAIAIDRLWQTEKQ